MSNHPGGSLERSGTPARRGGVPPAARPRDDALARELRKEVTRGLRLPVEVRVVPRFERRGHGQHRDRVKAADLGERARGREARCHIVLDTGMQVGSSFPR
jgi:hypothetical protein